MRFKRVLVAIIAPAVVALLTAAPASAVGSPHPAPGSVSAHSATLGQTSRSGTAPALTSGLGSNPYGCYGQTDNPHESGHNPGFANTVSRTVCDTWLAYLTAATDLYRLRWYGWQYLTSGGASGENVSSVQGPTSWNCSGVGTYTYEADTYHEADDYFGNYYTADTYAQARFGC
jgi:hypothetical protein